MFFSKKNYNHHKINAIFFHHFAANTSQNASQHCIFSVFRGFSQQRSRHEKTFLHVENFSYLCSTEKGKHNHPSA